MSTYAETVAKEVINALEEGTAPWIKTWYSGQYRAPYNPTTDNTYRGINHIYLSMQMFDDPRWMTYKQAEKNEFQVKRGAKGVKIQYWKFHDRQVIYDENGHPKKDEQGVIQVQLIPLVKPRVFYSTVFNAMQIEGVPELEYLPEQTWKNHTRAEAILKNSEATIIHEAWNTPHYSLTKDHIVLPDRKQFSSMDKYYATALHELGHWTGHPSRLNRDLAHRFGTKGYAREELRAELASLMLGAELGIGHDPGQHHAYIKSWVQLLKETPTEILMAAKDAEQIKQYVLGLEQKQEQQQNHDITTKTVIFIPGEDNAMVKPSPSNITESSKKILIDVPYREKNQAKNLGAKWDSIAKSWYIPEGISQEPFNRWLPQKPLPCEHSPLKAQNEFLNACDQAGLVLKNRIQMDGVLHRVSVKGDKSGEKSGTYIGFLDQQIPAGYIKNWKTGEEINWKYKEELTLTNTNELQETIKKAREQREKEQEERYKKVSISAKEQWLEAQSVAGQDHPYLMKKGVLSHHIKQNDQGQLIIPLQNTEGEILSLQTIDQQGKKRFLTGGKKQGCYYPIGSIKSNDPYLIISEGYATAASIHEATKLPVMVAFDAGNLKPVAVALYEKSPQKTLIIAGDNDHHRSTNVGQIKAQEAAQAVNGIAILPQFTAEEKQQKLTDFNDLSNSRGKETIINQIEVAIHEVEKKQQKNQHQQNMIQTQEAMHEL